MDIKSLILQKLKNKGEVKANDIVRGTGFSRTYVNRFFQELKDEGKLALIGRANQARYVALQKKSLVRTKQKITSYHRMLHNTDLSEDLILSDIKKNTGIFAGLAKNVTHILDYAFTEMLNNAIEHSKSKTIEVDIKNDGVRIRFDIVDHGIGIFNNLMVKRNLKNELEAIQDLMKGKQTTLPERHSGEGIFFTSKVADNLQIQSATKKLIFDNILGDIFIRDIKRRIGTKITFTIASSSRRNLSDVFSEYSGTSFEFSKTKVVVKLYTIDSIYISRSQGRRILSGLEKFKTIILDFQRVETVGQAFADEVFRVWKARYPALDITYENANENVRFMIQRVVVGV